MPPSTKTFYKILEVDSEASAEVIEAAYRRLARRYHPDVNKSPDATRMMQELNEAFGVLSDVQKRMSYDLYLRSQANAQQQQTTNPTSSQSQHRNTSNRPEPEPNERATRPNPYDEPSVAMATACEKCGRSDATLRFAQFPYVISLLIVTFRRGSRGLFCSQCRREKMSEAKILTTILGWWGIPFGPIFSLGVLFTSSEGEVDAKLNAEYLRYLTGYFLRSGNRVEAKKAIQASLQLQYDPELAAVAHSIFGDELRSSQTKSKPTQSKSTHSEPARSHSWFPPLLLVLVVGLIIYFIYIPPPPQPPPTPTPWPTRTVPATPSPVVIDWVQLVSGGGLITLEHPREWEIQRDTDETIELEGKDSTFMLFVMPGNTEGDIAATIERSEQDPDFVEVYNEPLYDYLETELKNLGGGLTRLGNPVIETIGSYSAISSDVEYFMSGARDTQAMRMWLYFFDCGNYLCQVNYTKNDSSAMTKEQQQIAEHIITSIKIPTRAPPPAPPPAADTSQSDTFFALSFCYDNELHLLSKKCARNRKVFTGMVERLYVSWTPSQEYKGATFLKKWYIDGNFILESESTNEYAYIEVDTRVSLKPGMYLVDIYVQDTLVARGNFEIR